MNLAECFDGLVMLSTEGMSLLLVIRTVDTYLMLTYCSHLTSSLIHTHHTPILANKLVIALKPLLKVKAVYSRALYVSYLRPLLFSAESCPARILSPLTLVMIAW